MSICDSLLPRIDAVRNPPDAGSLGCSDSAIDSVSLGPTCDATLLSGGGDGGRGTLPVTGGDGGPDVDSWCIPRSERKNVELLCAGDQGIPGKNGGDPREGVSSTGGRSPRIAAGGGGDETAEGYIWLSPLELGGVKIVGEPVRPVAVVGVVASAVGVVGVVGMVVMFVVVVVVVMVVTMVAGSRRLLPDDGGSSRSELDELVRPSRMIRDSSLAFRSSHCGLGGVPISREWTWAFTVEPDDEVHDDSNEADGADDVAEDDDDGREKLTSRPGCGNEVPRVSELSLRRELEMQIGRAHV